jgi:hypothetical protein
VIAIAVSLHAAGFAGAASSGAEPLHVGLDCGAATSIASQAIAEATRIWTPYDVDVRRVVSGGRAAIDIRVTITDRPPPTDRDLRAIGSIDFRAGIPVPQITLYEQRAWELIRTVAGPGADRWPVSYRERVIGRVLGRALAHEVGHFLLRSPHHSTRGLMRASPPLADFVEAGGSQMHLAPEDAAALAATRGAPRL